MGEQLECVELCLGMGDEPTGSLRARMKEKTGLGVSVSGSLL